jgi:hypothetical protein
MFSAHRSIKISDRAFAHMRIVLVMTASMALFTVVAQGATTTANCLPFPATFASGTGGPTPVSCPPFSGGAGAILNSATLSYSADYQFGGTPGTNQVMVTFAPAGPGGVTWAPLTTTVTVTGGASSGAIQTASATATAGVTAANFAAAFNVNISSAVTQGTVATSSGAVAVTYDFTAAPPPPPPPPTSMCDASIPVFAAQGPTDAFQTHYASNLNIGDSFVNITNAGTAIAPADGTPGNGNICVHVYTFSPDEQEVSCCSCLVTPNALVSLSVNNDLVSNTLTPARPTSVVVKLVATVGAGALAPGMRAWGTTIHAGPAGGFSTTENPFSQAALSAAELARITSFCGFIQANGSGFGICRGCRLGGLGATSR